MKVPIVYYSHTEYLDILKIQVDHLNENDNKILLINKNSLKLENLYKKFDKVIFYNDESLYAERLLSLKELDYDYILFIHDIDIILEKDDKILDGLTGLARAKNLDRIDLQYNYANTNRGFHEIEIDLGDEDKNFSLIKQVEAPTYIYNVNPSIWKLSTLLNIMDRFSFCSYRTIELEDVQNYCINNDFKIYKLHSENIIKCGYFTCLEFFKYLHITHGGKLLSTLHHSLDEVIKEKYNKIVEKYLIETKREFN